MRYSVLTRFQDTPCNCPCKVDESLPGQQVNPRKSMHAVGSVTCAEEFGNQTACMCMWYLKVMLTIYIYIYIYRFDDLLEWYGY